MKCMNKLKEFRKKYNFTQKEACELTGYNLQSWISYENNRRKVPMHLIKHIDLFIKYQSI